MLGEFKTGQIFELAKASNIKTYFLYLPLPPEFLKLPTALMCGCVFLKEKLQCRAFLIQIEYFASNETNCYLGTAIANAIRMLWPDKIPSKVCHFAKMSLMGGLGGL